MTGTQLALFSGACLGLALALAFAHFAPLRVDPADFVERTSPVRRRLRQPAGPVQEVSDTRDRVGIWAARALPGGLWRRTRMADLDILGIPLHRHYGRKVVSAAAGLVLAPVLTYVLSLYGLNLPLLAPGFISLAAAAFLFFLPDHEVHQTAAAAREEMVHALTAYIDLIALQRRGGAGARQSMTRAALISNGWVFRRLAQELRRSEFEGQNPWDALTTLSRRIEVPQLDDLGNVMRMSERSGAQIYASLRARATAMRSESLSDQRAKANAVSERLVLPTTVAGFVFLIIFITPAILRFATTV